MISASNALQMRLRKLGVDAVLFNTSEHLPSINLRYLSGFTGSDASLLITAHEMRLFTDGRYKSQAAREAPGFRLHVTRQKMESLARILARLKVKRLGIESARVSYEFVKALERKSPGVRIVDMKRSFVEELRIRKSPEEKRKIQEAAAIASRCCQEILERGLDGRTEIEVADELEMLFKRHRAQGRAFETIVASGERSAWPHGTATEKTIRKGELVIVDYGCVVGGYNSDETVTCVVGRPTREQQKIYTAAHTAHMKAIEALKIGVSVKTVDRVARDAIQKAGYGKHFLHGLGHGLGLEVHEPPRLSPLGRGVIDEGMVFTIEPGIYLEGVGGVRLESLIYMDRDGPEVLSRMPKELIRIEP
ncbi:MAG: aminopeptidase P family protein [Deltaproteobacteria bacterium]|nr:aminopeptidase P family protein [Deltaproteobacteria bacterium]